MIFTYYGHSCFSMEVGGKTLLFDPFITHNPKAAGIQLGSIKADYILISHAHGDHTGDAPALAKLTNAICISNYEIITWLEGQGITKVHPLNHGGQWRFDFGTVKYVNAIHSSSFADGRYGGNPGGFIIEAHEGTFYYAGDTALTMDMKLWGKQYDFDCVILPIGDNFTMGIEDAVRASKLLRCEKVVGVHFDTFPYIMIDHDVAKSAFKAKGRKLILPEVGGSFDI